jgi:hypothetical protein
MLEKNHWIVQSKLLKAAFNLGYSFNSLRAVLLEPGMTINNLPPPPPLQPGDNIPIGIGPRPKVDLGSDLPEFSISVLQECLVEFIVAHDEVCDAFRSGPVLLMSVSLSRQSTSSNPPHFADFFSFSAGIFTIQTSRIAPRCASSSLHPGEGVSMTPRRN